MVSCMCMCSTEGVCKLRRLHTRRLPLPTLLPSSLQLSLSPLLSFPSSSLSCSPSQRTSLHIVDLTSALVVVPMPRLQSSGAASDGPAQSGPCLPWTAEAGRAEGLHLGFGRYGGDLPLPAQLQGGAVGTCPGVPAAVPEHHDRAKGRGACECLCVGESGVGACLR